MNRPPIPADRSRQAAFTMVELLTVIAIIAVLAAILFPVFASVQESARRSSTMSNLQKIAQAVAAYELDNREYPEYLFGPAVSQTDGTPFGGAPYYSMKDAAAIVNRGAPSAALPTATVAGRIRRIYSKSLYPNYIRDINVFACPNNTVRKSDGADDVVLAERYPTYDPTNGTMARNIPTYKVELPFYKFDAFDASPRITSSDGAIDANTFVVRYSRAWYPITTTGAPAPDSDPQGANDDIRLAKYRRQLLWRQPPSETMITATTHHAPKGKVVVLWLNGTAKVLDVRKFAGNVDGAGDFRFFETGPND